MIGPAYSVQVKVGNVVAKVSQVLLAARLGSAAGVGRTHVGGDLANNVAESHLVLDHLVVAVLLGDGAQVQVSPGVRGDLVALSVHTLDDADKFRSKVDLALVDVVSSNEEGSLGLVLGHNVKNVASENLLWAVIVGNGDRSWLGAAVDTIATILNVAELRTGNGRGVGTTWGQVLRASGAMLIVTTRGEAVVRISSTVYN